MTGESERDASRISLFVNALGGGGAERNPLWLRPPGRSASATPAGSGRSERGEVA